MSPRWEAVIGLEVHVQLATATKLFCRCPAVFGRPPNSLICPVCAGHPGTLPVLNAGAVRLGVRAALALGASVDTVLQFARKHYAYPDLPKGYQITQHQRPLARDGELGFLDEDGMPRRVQIVQAHLEEDAGKLIHPAHAPHSLLDDNRAGTPLLEVVSAPQLHSPAQASAFLAALRRTLRHAEVTDGDMQNGSLRCDANVSLRPHGSDALGTRTEVKNLNSFRFLAQALSAEIERQTRILEDGSEVRAQTLGFDADSGSIHPLRDKQDELDYRYLPEPNLPPYALDPGWIAALRAELPEDPLTRRQRFIDDLGLAPAEADALLEERPWADLFENAARASGQPRATASWLLTEVRRVVNARGQGLDALQLTAERLLEVFRLVQGERVSVAGSRRILEALAEGDERPADELAQDLDLLQLSGDEDLAPLVAAILARENDLVLRYRAGQTGVLDALLGAALQQSGERGNPRRLRALLEQALQQDKGPGG